MKLQEQLAEMVEHVQAERMYTDSWKKESESLRAQLSAATASAKAEHRKCYSCGRCKPVCGCGSAETCMDMRCPGNTIAELRAQLAATRAEAARLREALEKIIEHELYHGVNQGIASEDIAREALKGTS